MNLPLVVTFAVVRAAAGVPLNIENLLTLVISATLASATSIIIARINILPKLKETEAKVESTQVAVARTTYEITNNHDVHLRDDLDNKFDGLDSRLTQILDMQIQSSKHINNIDGKLESHISEGKKELAEVDKKIFELAERIGE